jgi:hypothetical protein
MEALMAAWSFHGYSLLLQRDCLSQAGFSSLSTLKTNQRYLSVN